MKEKRKSFLLYPPPPLPFPILRSLGCSQASKPPSLEPENGRRRTRNEWTDERTGQQRGRGKEGQKALRLPPPPFPFPDLVKFSLLSDEGGKEKGEGILPSLFLSRYVEKEAFFSSFGLAASPPLDPARLLTASPSEHLCLKAKVEEAAIWRLGGGRAGKENKIGHGGKIHF